MGFLMFISKKQVHALVNSTIYCRFASLVVLKSALNIFLSTCDSSVSAVASVATSDEKQQV